MTNDDLALVYTTALAYSHKQALEVIYMMGVCDGQGVARTAGAPASFAAAQTKPTAADIANLIKNARK